jgi:hypothetical protein
MVHGFSPVAARLHILLAAASLLMPQVATAQRAWSPPVTVTPSGLPSKLPRLAMDGNGNAVATWIREEASGTTARQTQAARLTATGLWEHPVDLYAPAATAAVPGEASDVALNAAGRGAAVWVRAIGTGSTDHMVQGAIFNAGWSTAVNLMPGSGASAASPRVGVDDDGNAIAAWVQVLDGSSVVRATRYSAGSTWSAPVTVSLPGENVADRVALAVDGAGNAVAAWTSIAGGVPTLRASQYTELTNAWSEPITIGSAGRSPTVVRLALNRSGTAGFVAFRSFDGTRDLLRAARLEPVTGQWSAPALVSTPGQDVFDLDISVDEQGRAVALWNRFDGTFRTIQSARYVGGWSTPDSRMVGADTRDVSVDTDAAGNAVAAWTRSDGSRYGVQASAFSVASGAWTVAAEVSDPTGDAAVPQVRLHADGTAVAIWQDSTGASSIRSSRYVRQDAPVLQPATVNGPDVTLQWSTSASGPAPQGFTVVASRTPGGTPAIWRPVGIQTSLVVAAQSGAYYVRVLALIDGLEVSSNEIEVIVGAGPAPAAPQNFTAAASGSIVTMTWTPPANAAVAPVVTYSVEAGSAEGVSNLAHFPTGNTQTMYVSPPVPNGSYWVRVRAQGAGGLGPPTPDVRVVVGPPPPGAPTLSGGQIGPGTVQLQWTAAPVPGVPVTGYQLQAGSSPGLSNIAVFTLPASALDFSTVGVPSGTYYVRVWALSAAGPGTPSNEVVVTVVP